jgi:hypothetical protein
LYKALEEQLSDMRRRAFDNMSDSLDAEYRCVILLSFILAKPKHHQASKELPVVGKRHIALVLII